MPFTNISPLEMYQIATTDIFVSTCKTGLTVLYTYLPKFSPDAYTTTSASHTGANAWLWDA